MQRLEVFTDTQYTHSNVSLSLPSTLSSAFLAQIGLTSVIPSLARTFTDAATRAATAHPRAHQCLVAVKADLYGLWLVNYSPSPLTGHASTVNLAGIMVSKLVRSIPPVR